MKVWGLLIAGAVLPFLFHSTLSSWLALTLLCVTLLVAFRPGLRVYCLFPFFFMLTTLQINARIAERWPLLENRQVHAVTGTIASLPDSSADVVRFTFIPDADGGMYPEKIRVYWYRNRTISEGADNPLPQVRAGERWRLQLELRAARGRVNFVGVDAERWYFADGIGALGYVKEGPNVLLAPAGRFNLQHWREVVYEILAEKAGSAPAFRMLAALAIADRRGLLAADRQILSATGTGHLLAISGLHVGLAAALGFYLGRLLGLLTGIDMLQRFALALPWLSAWSAALIYSALSGFGVSTQRALIMLTVVTVVMASRRNVQPFLAWMLALALVLIADPFAPLRAGFWFSFAAVAVLIMVFSPRQGHMPVWRKMLLAQLGISLVLAPLGMYWFQQASLPGLLANLVAIPLVSMVIVPLILASLLLLWLPGPIAAWLLTAAGWATQWLFMLLEWLSYLQPPVFSSTRVPGLAAVLLGMLGAGVLLLPRGVPFRFAGALLVLPLLVTSGQHPEMNATRVDFLDVGQGLAVVLSKRDYLMVYDTGPGNGRLDEDGWDMVSGTIGPMLTATGMSPDLVVASHADLDHAGGLNRLLKTYPDARFLASLPEKRPGIGHCRAPGTWRGGNLSFEILHPSSGLPYLGNNSSCVISVHGAGMSLLLSGDIGLAVEQRLVDRGLQPHDILTVPHHGSLTSSSEALIAAVKPSLALISAGMNNRFGFPREEVTGRYAKAQIPTLNTAQCGGIRITGYSDGNFETEAARVVRKAIWRWPAGAGCPLDH